MKKEEIYNNYAKEQGYESWRELVMDYVFDSDGVLNYEDLINHQNKVTDLIQEELKKKIHNELNGVNFYNRTYFEHCRKEILNTEIL